MVFLWTQQSWKSFKITTKNVTSLVTLQWDPNWFFSMCDLEIWQMTSRNNREPLPCFQKVWVSFHSYPWIQIGVAIRKHLYMTLKFDISPWKIIGHLFYATSSFVLDSVAIRGFKLKIQSRNAQFRSKSSIFRPMWPWNLMDDLEKQ